LDNVTHTIFAATLARTPLARAGRGTTAALIIASIAPDIDIVATAGGSLKYLEWHRGPTHGLLGIVGLGLLTAGVVWTSQHIRDQRASARGDASAPSTARAERPDHKASFGMLAAVSMIGVLLHLLMDLPTSYGTRVLSPFDWHWFAVDWMPIVDIYLLMVLVVPLFGRSTAAQRQKKAAVVLVLMAANYGLRAYAHHQALEIAPRLFGPTLPELCDPPPATVPPIDVWPRGTPPSPPTPGRRCLVEIAAMPTFTSPFRWRIIAQMSNAYELHEIDLLDKNFTDPEYASEAPWRMTVRYPNVWTPAVMKAAATRVGQTFLAFSRFPAARSAVDSHGITTVRWTDVRFVGGVVALDQPGPPTRFFTATVRIAPDGTVLEQFLGAR
jgi:inner membrane protein